MIEGLPEKVNSYMKVDKVIYPDRFLFQNREESSKLRAHVANLRDKVKYLEACLDTYKRFNQTDYNLTSVLSLATDFLKMQGKPTYPALEGKKVEGVTTHLPNEQQKSQSGVEPMIKSLEAFT